MMLLIDIGGTFIKYTTSDENGNLAQARQVPSRSDEGADAVLDTLSRIISSCEGPVERACISTPGPFDFSTGTSYMKHKFAALYGRSLTPPFTQAGIPVTFLHDSTSFILGEYYDGALRGAQRPCCVMLGTGLGFACMENGRACVDQTQTPYIPLWKMPYRDGIAEDYVSTRAIRSYYGEDISVLEISTRARAGDAKAIAAFRTMGEHISEIMTGMIRKLDSDRFALGGQIALSADLMHIDLPIQWAVSQQTEDGPLHGAYHYARLGQDQCIRFMEP